MEIEQFVARVIGNDPGRDFLKYNFEAAATAYCQSR
jgi:hypothetical protein